MEQFTETLESLRKGDMALVNDGTLDELREACLIVWPESEPPKYGDSKHYFANLSKKGSWTLFGLMSDNEIPVTKFLKEYRLETYELRQIFEMIDLLRNSVYNGKMLRVSWKKQPFTKEYVMCVEIHTGGLSHNENLVESFLKNPNTHTVYEMWKRGGHHYFEIPPSIAGYECVSDFCKKNNKSRQSVYQNKHRYDWLYSDSKKKVFVRLKKNDDGK